MAVTSTLTSAMTPGLTVVHMATSLTGDGVAGVTSPPCAVTPVDHDYAKRKKLQQRQAQPQDGTVPGPESILSHSLTHWGAVTRVKIW